MTEQTANVKDARSYRLTNIDMMRGLVIIIMAIDHVRDYFNYAGGGVSVSDPGVDAAFYVTRWITHFCAPVFVFLAGTSIGLMQERRTKSELSKFIFKRGLWLVFCEIFIISTAVSFAMAGEPALGGNLFTFMQVLFAMGVSMMLLAGALYLGAKNCLILGMVIISGNHAILSIWPSGNPFGGGNDPAWITILAPGGFIVEPFYFIVLYPPIQWFGIMLVGFGSSYIFRKDPAERDTALIKMGIVSILLFIALRLSNMYGDPNLWEVQELGVLSTVFDFFDVTKYPVSLLYTLITLGPAAILCAYADRFNGWFKDTLVMFGRVPFFFYVAHFYLIHSLSVALGVYQGFELGQMLHAFPFYPQGYGISLLGVYVVWLLVLAILYPLCKWMMKIKSSRKDWWLSYL